MMDHMRKQLQELMKTVETDQAPKKSFTDPDICRHFLTGLCPHDLFVNTKLYLGDCKGIHDEEIREDYFEARKIHNYGHEYEAVRYIRPMINECDAKINKSLVERGENLDQIKASLSSVKQKEIDRVGADIQQRLEEAQKLGADGNVNESMQVMEQVSHLEAEKKQLERALEHKLEETKNLYFQKLRPCEACGALLSERDDEGRKTEHLSGRIHIGFEEMRKHYKVLNEYIEQTASKLPFPHRDGKVQQQIDGLQGSLNAQGGGVPPAVLEARRVNALKLLQRGSPSPTRSLSRSPSPGRRRRRRRKGGNNAEDDRLKSDKEYLSSSSRSPSRRRSDRKRSSKSRQARNDAFTNTNTSCYPHAAPTNILRSNLAKSNPILAANIAATFGATTSASAQAIAAAANLASLSGDSMKTWQHDQYYERYVKKPRSRSRSGSSSPFERRRKNKGSPSERVGRYQSRSNSPDLADRHGRRSPSYSRDTRGRRSSSPSPISRGDDDGHRKGSERTKRYSDEKEHDRRSDRERGREREDERDGRRNDDRRHRRHKRRHRRDDDRSDREGDSREDRERGNSREDEKELNRDRNDSFHPDEKESKGVNDRSSDVSPVSRDDTRKGSSKSTTNNTESKLSASPSSNRSSNKSPTKHDEKRYARSPKKSNYSDDDSDKTDDENRQCQSKSPKKRHRTLKEEDSPQSKKRRRNGDEEEVDDENNNSLNKEKIDDSKSHHKHRQRHQKHKHHKVRDEK